MEITFSCEVNGAAPLCVCGGLLSPIPKGSSLEKSKYFIIRVIKTVAGKLASKAGRISQKPLFYNGVVLFLAWRSDVDPCACALRLMLLQNVDSA